MYKRIHNISQRRQRTDQATAIDNMIKNLVKLGHVVFELCE